MGLLSNPKSRQKLVTAVSKYNNILCVLCYVVGVTWFMALAYTPLNAKTYFSENALLPGIFSAFLPQHTHYLSLCPTANICSFGTLPVHPVRRIGRERVFLIGISGL